MDGPKQAKRRRHNRTKAKLSPLPRQSMPEGVTLPSLCMHNRAAMEVKIRPKLSDLESDEAMWALYCRWCLHYNIHRTPEEMDKRFNNFKKSAREVFEMNQTNQMDPSCQFHLSFVCDEKDLFDRSGDEELTPTPTERDLESDEAVLDLYYRWCLYHKVLRTAEEMQQRVKYFKMSAIHAIEMNQKDPSCLSIWCDKINLCYWSDVKDMKTLAPTEGDLKSDTDLWDLYHRWCLHHKILRTPEEMQLRFDNFKKSATHVFEMSQKDPTIQYLLSFGCDETDLPVPKVTVIPTERDLKSGNALLDLYHRYCLYYKIHRIPEEMKQRFSNFKKSVNHVFEKNKKDPSCQFYLSSYCDEKDLLDWAAKKVRIVIRPTASDLESKEAVWDLYRRWCIHQNMQRAPQQMNERFHMFKRNADHVFRMNEMDPSCQFHLSFFCDGKDLFDRSNDEEMTSKPTESDLESGEAVLDLYYRWCLYHKILRTPKEMQKRFKYFKMSAIHAIKMNQEDPLSIWCDKIDRSVVEDMETLAPTEGDLKSTHSQDLFRRSSYHQKMLIMLDRMQVLFDKSKKSPTQAYEMFQKELPHIRFCRSFGCDETNQPVPEVTVIPTERDLKSDNALLGLYHRYCLYYKIHRTPEEMKQRFSNFKKSVNHVFEKNKKDPSCQFYLTSYCDEKDLLDWAAKKVRIVIRPTLRDFQLSDTVHVLYRRWCRHYNIRRTPQEMRKRFNIFGKNALQVFEMNRMDPSCQFHLSSSCDEKDLFDWAGDEDMTPTPTKRDMKSGEAVMDLYYRWCLYHKILRTPEEMQQRVKYFKMSATHAIKMNKKDTSCLSKWCDKINLCDWSGGEDMTLTPTKGVLESDEALMDLYHRWCLHHKIQRTPGEMWLRFDNFKNTVTHVFELSQKDSSMQYCLSFGCDETDVPVPDVTVIPTERDLESGNALLGLYHRFCLYYKKQRPSDEMKQRFNIFKKSVCHVWEKNKNDPSCQFYLGEYCDGEVFDTYAAAAKVEIVLRPTASDVESDEAVWALYRRWRLVNNIHRTRKEMRKRFRTFKKSALEVFEWNCETPNMYGLVSWSDKAGPSCCGSYILSDDEG